MDNQQTINCFRGSTTREEVEKFLKECEEESEPTLIQTILEEMECDDEDESERLLLLYLNSNERDRALLDCLLVSLCGWTMSTLIEKTREKRAEENN